MQKRNIKSNNVRCGDKVRGPTLLFEACRQRDGRAPDTGVVDMLLSYGCQASAKCEGNEATPAHALVAGWREFLFDGATLKRGATLQEYKERLESCTAALRCLCNAGADLGQLNSDRISAIGELMHVLVVLRSLRRDACSEDHKQQFVEATLTLCPEEFRCPVQVARFEGGDVAPAWRAAFEDKLFAPAQTGVCWPQRVFREELSVRIIEQLLSARNVNYDPNKAPRCNISSDPNVLLECEFRATSVYEDSVPETPESPRAGEPLSPRGAGAPPPSPQKEREDGVLIRSHRLVARGMSLRLGDVWIDVRILAPPSKFRLADDGVAWEMMAPDRAAWVDAAFPPRLRDAIRAVHATFDDGGATYEINHRTMTLSGRGSPLDGWIYRWQVQRPTRDVNDSDVEVEVPDVDAQAEIDRIDKLPNAPAVRREIDGAFAGAEPPRENIVTVPPAPIVAVVKDPNPELVVIKLTDSGVMARQGSVFMLLLILKFQLPAAALDVNLLAKESQYRVRMTAEQKLELDKVLRNINAYEEAMDAGRGTIRSTVYDAQKKLLKVLRDNDIKCQEGDPVLRMLQDFFFSLREHYTVVLERLLKEFADKVEERGRLDISTCVNDVDNAVTRISTALDEIVTSVMGCARVALDANQARMDLLKQYIATARPKDDAFRDAPEQARALDHFIQQILRRASTNFVLPKILRDLNIHFVSAQRQLTFYTDSGAKLLESFAKSDVLVVKTATGTGKSTLMPFLVLASGIAGADGTSPIRHIAVTQPRRLAAESLRTNLADSYGEPLVGYNMAGRSCNPAAPVVYYTDGLLRHRLHPTRPNPFDVIIIDEVHERSAEIDGCVALLALRKKLLVQTNERRAPGTPPVRMPKIILSSATFDPAIEGPLLDAGLSVAHLDQEPRARYSRTLHYPDAACNAGCNICAALLRSSHYVNIVVEMQKALRGTQQLLVFLPSVLDVQNAVTWLEDRNVVAEPLYGQMSPAKQLEALAHGRIFVSTNIAETSLTFKNLKFVVDVGKSQRPRWTPWGVQMETIDAPESTLRQRQGRVGRTCDGHYIACYQQRGVRRQQHIDPKLEIEGDEDFLFSLALQLIDVPRPVEIQLPRAKKEARVTLEALDRRFAQYPMLGSKAMTKAFDDAREAGCNFNVLCFAAIRKCTSAKVFQLIGSEASKAYKTPGDVTGVLCLMTRVVSQYQRNWKDGLEDDDQKRRQSQRVRDLVTGWAEVNGFGRHSRVLARAVVDALGMLSHLRKNHVPILTQDPTQYAVVLAPIVRHHERHVFLSLQVVCGPKGYYSRALDRGDGGDDDGSTMRTIASIHTKSGVYASIKDKVDAPVIVFSLDFMLLHGDMSQVVNPYRLGVMQTCEPLDLRTVGHIAVSRRIRLLPSETAPPGFQTEDRARITYITLKGRLDDVVSRSKSLFTALRDEKSFKPEAPPNALPMVLSTFEDNVKKLAEQRFHVFRQLKFTWMNTCGVEVEANRAGPNGLEIKMKGRRGEVAQMLRHLKFWNEQLGVTPLVHLVDHFATMRSFCRPAKLGEAECVKADQRFRERLRFCTSDSVDPMTIWNNGAGPHATRETRMMCVARIAIHEFHCRISGGFVRDWIIRGEAKHPAREVDPSNLWNNDWIEDKHRDNPAYPIRFDMREGVLPKDIDAELPCDQYFDVGRFIARVRECGVDVDYHEHAPQRHVFVFDVRRGPFTIDLVDFHFAMLHTMADFDCNMLCMMSPCENLLGLKADFVRRPDGGKHDFSVDAIVARIQREEFCTLRPIERIMKSRRDKMCGRGWTEKGHIDLVPPTGKANCASLLGVSEADPIVQPFWQRLEAMGARSIAAWRIENAETSAIFEATRSRIAAANGGNANVRTLWHGGKRDGIFGVLNTGFDRRYWQGGNGAVFGRAAYFASIPEMSHTYTDRTGNDRFMLVCDVVLGKQQRIPEGAYEPEVGIDSACASRQFWHRGQDQFMIYKEGQAMPLYLFRYTKAD